MAGRTSTVADMISSVRSIIDEENNAAIDTDTDILPALNRAQDYAANVLARQYESPLLTYVDLQLVSGQRDYDIPKDALEERIEKVEVKQGNLYYPLTRLSYRDVGDFETDSFSPIPSYYTVISDKFRLVPGPTGNYQIRVWYLKDPLPLVMPQGRVTYTSAGDNFLLVDSIGDDLTTETDNLNSYVNVVDGRTGVVKGSFQIRTIADTKITFKTIPSRTEVLGQTISTDMTTLSELIEPDDYICTISGNCIPFLKKPTSNFIIQYAVAELTRKLGGASDMEERVKKDLEAQVEHSWAGRESTLRVKMVNTKWSKLRRRFWR
jgi:hypothetical protein